MFERFTGQARRVVALAQEEAGMPGHHHIAPEHILLVLVHPDAGLAARALDAHGSASCCAGTASTPGTT